MYDIIKSNEKDTITLRVGKHGRSSGEAIWEEVGGGEEKEVMEFYFSENHFIRGIN